MKIEVNVRKRYVFMVLGALLVVGALIGVIAYAPGSTTANPAVFGHSANEIEGGGGGVPVGAIMMFDTACPSGWTRFAELDGRVPRGSDTPGGIGGAETHVHSGSGIEIEDQDLYYSVVLSGATANNWPPYLNVIWCKKN